MSSLILHHYPTSPYSEKLRNVLGFKNLAWASVTTPFILPKPDLMPLTGGYRKAPVMQVGRDVICDSALMLRVIERLHPTPALIPAGLEASCAAFAALEQTLFFGAVATVFRPEGAQAFMQRMGGELMQKFAADRAALFTGGQARRPGPDASHTQYLPAIAALDAQLASQPWLLGAAPTQADFVCYHPVWFVLGNPGVAPLLQGFPNLLAWAARVKALGHGQPTELAAEAALEVARSSRDWLELDGAFIEPVGIKLGDAVTVQATDYGCDPVAGSLVHASAQELVLARSDVRAGEVRVHFPRMAFAVAKA